MRLHDLAATLGELLRIRTLRRFVARHVHDFTNWFYARAFASGTRREQNFVPADLLA